MNESILFFDGKLKHIERLQSYLFEEGINPLFASTSREAIDKIERFSPALIMINCHDMLLNEQDMDSILNIQKAASETPVIFIANGEADQLRTKQPYAEIINETDDQESFIQSIERVVQWNFNIQRPEHNIHILIAEDDIVIRKTVERLLTKQGYQRLRLATDGEEAWEFICDSEPGLIILDYMMPRATGFDVLQRIRSNYHYDHIPVIFLTAINDKERLIEALDAGATDYITKPFDQSELLARVNTHARNYYLQKQVLKINEHLGRINKELSTKNAQIEADLRSARKIQEALLPKESMTTDVMDIRFLYKPSHSVGGDFLNFVQLDATHTAFYIADVSGHGVTSAMITVFVREQIANIIRKYAKHPLTAGEVLCQLNLNYNEEIYFLDNGVYLTIFFGIINTEMLELNYSSAGHHAFPIICSKDGTTSEIKDTEIAIGFLDEYDFSDRTMQLSSGDRILLHTDGIMEMRNQNDEFFGLERLKQHLHENHTESAEKIMNSLVEISTEFSNQDEQPDDIALLLVDIK
ncbi:fused response regulator/phosphatase [candidate division KSB1 bacterium]|nr:fused response regulator/phosphatase [candidate division KSB1 bacterium]